ncbi:MAG: hypothetical protein U1E02_05445 [Hydrogenophaga sp.]|jgi:hypothetical protein|nr:hypothetical protein [Hydrogenophaga sp.]MDZ4123608.1 hypothetical protein [Hydrogenophaga sp.]
MSAANAPASNGLSKGSEFQTISLTATQLEFDGTCIQPIQKMDDLLISSTR